MEARDVITKLYETARTEPEIIPLALAGIAIGITTYYIVPAISDITKKIIGTLNPPIL
jgi:hypothetical protein